MYTSFDFQPNPLKEVQCTDSVLILASEDSGDNRNIMIKDAGRKRAMVDNYRMYDLKIFPHLPDKLR